MTEPADPYISKYNQTTNYIALTRLKDRWGRMICASVPGERCAITGNFIQCAFAVRFLTRFLSMLRP